MKISAITSHEVSTVGTRVDFSIVEQYELATKAFKVNYHASVIQEYLSTPDDKQNKDFPKHSFESLLQHSQQLANLVSKVSASIELNNIKDSMFEPDPEQLEDISKLMEIKAKLRRM